MKDNMGFKASLSLGNHGEKLVLETLESFGFIVEKSSIKEIDIYFEYMDKKFSGECKWDLYSAKSGNFAIETFNTKLCKPSGVMSTIADFWFHIDSSKKIYFCRVSSLKDFINKVKPKREITSGGDNNANLMLYSIEIICEQCLIELTKSNLEKEIKNL